MWPLLGVFLLIAGGLFAADLWAHRGAQKPITLSNAAAWSCAYVAGALAFMAYLSWARDDNAAALFLTGFVMEKALSVDNLMVFVAIFAYFKIPDAFQHRVLHYGIIGAVVFRLIFVALGAGSLEMFGPVVGLVFAFFVIWSAWKMVSAGAGEAEEVDYSNQWYVRWARGTLAFTNELVGPDFFTWQDCGCGLGAKECPVAHRYGTPLLLCLIAIEISDVLFSFDSVPAVIAVTREPALVYTAMIFAILGLRQLYFVLTAMLRYLTHLGTAVIAVLFFIGAKMLFQSLNEIGLPWHMPDISPIYSLAVVVGILGLGVVVSILCPEKTSEE